MRMGGYVIIILPEYYVIKYSLVLIQSTAKHNRASSLRATRDRAAAEQVVRVTYVLQRNEAEFSPNPNTRFSDVGRDKINELGAALDLKKETRKLLKYIIIREFV